MLFALDAICISAGDFQPHGRYKPGEAWRTDQDRAGGAARLRTARASGAADRGGREACRSVGSLPPRRATARRSGRTDRGFPRASVLDGDRGPGDKNQRERPRLRPSALVSHAGPRPRLARWAVVPRRIPAQQPQHDRLRQRVFCGFDKNPLARVQIDVTKGVQPGQVNELWVGIKDGWYARETDPEDPLKLRRTFNLPLAFFGNGFQNLVYPVWNQKPLGILGTPELVSTGTAYAADVFAKPSVARKELGVEVTLTNPTGRAAGRRGGLRGGQRQDGPGRDDRPAAEVLDPRGKEQLLDFAAKWEKPKLWWPDDPNCYRLRTTVQVDGQPVDVQETLFGFREWTRRRHPPAAERRQVAGLHGARCPRQQHAGGHCRLVKTPKFNYGFGRMWPQHGGRYKWLGQEPEEVLDVHGPRRRADSPHRLPGRRGGRLHAERPRRSSAATGSTISRPGSRASAIIRAS